MKTIRFGPRDASEVLDVGGAQVSGDNVVNAKDPIAIQLREEADALGLQNVPLYFSRGPATDPQGQSMYGVAFNELSRKNQVSKNNLEILVSTLQNMPDGKLQRLRRNTYSKRNFAPRSCACITRSGFVY